MSSNKRQDTLREIFLENRMALDKSILFVSTGAIAILVNFASGKTISILEMILLSFSVLAFLLVSVTVLFIFKINSDYLLAMVSKQDHSKTGCTLKVLDRFAIYGLISAIISASIFFLDYIVSNSFIYR